MEKVVVRILGVLGSRPVGKSTGKPAALKYATRTLTHGIPLTRNANAGLSAGTDPWVWVPVWGSV